MSMLEIRRVSIAFGGVQALEDVDLKVENNEIHSIIGPNGAGKTTLFNCISRIYRPKSGDMIFMGQDLLKLKPYQIIKFGIARTFQNIELFNYMSVLQNVMLSQECHRKTRLFFHPFFVRAVRDEEISHRRQAEDVLDFLELQAYRDQLIVNLPYGVQKRVELARSLAARPRLLLLDEPSAGMSVEETQDLITWIIDIKEEMGVTMLLVEHDMRVVREISDRITVLDFGKKIAEGSPEGVLKKPEVIRAYLGEEERENGIA
jgi:branched-chain amino acid transport system ATP-binding protein